MSENILPPRIKFYENHRPTMDPGDYTVVVENKVEHGDITVNNEGQITRRFAVYGERFQIDDQAIRAVFPAPGSTGEYASILPHIILNRNTLPWERHAQTGNHELPWLALLMFDEAERPDLVIATVADLKQGAASGADFPSFSQESAQHDDDRLTVIDVPKAVLQKLLPSAASLKLSAHTRQGIDAGHLPVGEENAVVFCSRLPEQGKRSTMHLVSLEGRYDQNGFVFNQGKDLIRLVSLKHWDFYTLEHFKISEATMAALEGKESPEDLAKISTLLGREFAGTEDEFIAEVAKAAGFATFPESYRADLVQAAKFDKTFDGLLKHLDHRLLSLRLPDVEDVNAQVFVEEGMVPLLHHFRNGDVSVSWFRGPFAPTAPVAVGVRNVFPETADELLQYHDNLGMFDVSYAAAWEMGRMMALRSKDFSTNLYKWKRYAAQSAHQTRQLQEMPHLPGFGELSDYKYYGLIWQNQLLPWLQQILRLESVPGNYLLPDAKLVPEEAIRFFHVDAEWLAMAMQGAMSVGGDWDKDLQEAENDFNTLLGQELPYKFGFILRSDVVEGWPGILIDGYDAEGNKLEPLKRMLAPGLLLCLFSVPLSKVVFHQKPEVMHFGLMKDNAQFFKQVRDLEGNEVGQPLAVNWQGDPGNRVLDLAQLATTLGKTGHGAQFAMNMVEGVPEVIFNIQ